MADKKNRLLSKVRSGTRNVRPAQLRKLMDIWGFECNKTKEGRTYYHPLYSNTGQISVVEHREKGQENKILERYVKNCLKAIDEIRLAKGEYDEGD
jgi:hypothetical protein